MGIISLPESRQELHFPFLKISALKSALMEVSLIFNGMFLKKLPFTILQVKLELYLLIPRLSFIITAGFLQPEANIVGQKNG